MFLMKTLFPFMVEWIMPRRVRVPQRVVQGVRVAIQALRVAQLGHDAVGLDEAPDGGVVVARAVEVQPCAPVEGLACKAAVRRSATALVACLTPRLVAQLSYLSAATVHRDAGRAEVIRQQIGERTALAHGDALPIGVVVGGQRADPLLDAPLGVITDVVGGAAITDALDALPVAIVAEARDAGGLEVER